MALVPFASQELALVSASASQAARLAQVLSTVSGLRQLVRMQAIASGLTGTAHAVSVLVEHLRPYAQNVATLKSALTGAVRSFWKNDHPRASSPQKEVDHVRQLLPVIHQLKSVAPYKGKTSGLVSQALVKAPSQPEILKALTPLVRVNKPAAAMRVPPKSVGPAIDFHSLAKARRSQLVGVEPNPGPRGGNKQLALASGVAAAYGNRIVTMNPKISMSKGGRSTRIRHRELLDASIAGSTAFKVQKVVPLNPGLEETFAWLSPQALQWEQYIAHTIRLIYIPIAPTSTQGTISVSPSYDPSDPEPLNEQQLSNAVDTVETSVWQHCVIPLNPRSMMTPGPRKFVRGALVAGDIKTFDAGVVYIATNNCSGISPIGKLWIEYDFEFFVPQNSPNVGLSPSKVSYWLEDTDQSLANAVTTVIDWAPALEAHNPLGIVFDETDNSFVLPRGFYRISLQSNAYLVGTSGSTTAMSLWYKGEDDAAVTLLSSSSHATMPSGDCAYSQLWQFYWTSDGQEKLTLWAKLTAPTTRTLETRQVTFEVV